jgi:hydrogenase maturation protease
MDIPQDVEVIDGGTSPDLPYYIEDVDKLIIVDAVTGDGPPGSIYRFHPEDVNLQSERALSVHELNLEESLRTMRLMGNKPKEVVIIGVEPKEMGWGTELSSELQQKMPEIIKIVLNELAV